MSGPDGLEQRTAWLEERSELDYDLLEVEAQWGDDDNIDFATGSEP